MIIVGRGGGALKYRSAEARHPVRDSRPGSCVWQRGGIFFFLLFLPFASGADMLGEVSAVTEADL